MDRISEASEFHSMIFAGAIWHIWENRNSCRNGSNRRETSTSIQKWSPPPEGLLMINVDAAIFSKSGRAGFGLVMCDYKGLVRAACRGFLNHVYCPEVAEAYAICQAFILAENTGVQRLEVASDCLSVIKKVQQQSMDRSLTGATTNSPYLRNLLEKRKASLFIWTGDVHSTHS